MVTAGAACLFAACKKGDNAVVVPPATKGYASLSKAYEDVAPKSKIVTLNAAAGGSFYGNSGTRYHFPANAFQTASGTLVAGNINIEVLECLTESDMIFSKMLTMSNGKPLISAGEFNVKASQYGVAVYIRPGMSYQVSLPTNKGAATAGMSYFSGTPSTTFTGSIVNWNLSIVDSLRSIVYDGDTIRMTPDSVGFINCDKYPAADFAAVNVRIDGISGSLKQEDFNAYYVLDGLLSAASIYSGTLAFTFNTYTGAKILKMKAHYVVCAVYGGEFYGGILKDITAVDGNTYTITISKTNPAAFKILIDALK